MAVAAIAVLCGCGLLAVLGAPQRMPMMNAAALLVGVVAAQILWFLRGLHRGTADVVLVAASLTLTLTALFGPQADGVARWLIVAGVTIQPGLIVSPLIVMALASRANKARVAAAALASLGLALQPDAGVAAMLVLGLGATAIATRSTRVFTALMFSVAGGAVALARPVDLPPAPFVEGVFATAFQSGVAATPLTLAGVLLLFLPALLLWKSYSRAVAVAFAGVWAGGLLAALLGPYPTPVLGFGGSAVLGYLLSVALLPMQSSALRGTAPSPLRAADCQSHELA